MRGSKEMRMRGMIRKCRLGLMLGLTMVMAVPSAVIGFAAPKAEIPVKEMSALDMSVYVDELDEELDLEESLDASTWNGQDSGIQGMNFVTRRLILLTDSLEEDYGASEILKYSDLNTYLLQYDSEEEAAAAYTYITEDLGITSCYVDGIIQEDALTDWKGSDSYPNYDDRNAKVVSWGTAFMGMDQLRLNVQNDNKVTVAIIDTGLDVKNPFFEGRTISKKCYNFGTHKKGLKNMKDGEYDGHGTHVAGIIVDATPANVEILPIRVMFGGVSPDSDFIAAIDYAIENGADVINCSFQMGDYGSGHGCLDDVLEKAKKANVVVVAATGNNSEQYVTYPGSSDQTVGVGALDTSGKEIAYFSDWGDMVDFVSPGVEIYSAFDGNHNPGEYKMMDGTSMATPGISAAYAYLKMLYPQDSWSKQYKRMKGLCRDLKKKGKDIYTGWGVPIMSGLLETVHVHNFMGDAASKNAHNLICQDCGFTVKEPCSMYHVGEDGVFVCDICGNSIRSTLKDNLLNVALADKDQASLVGIRKAAAEHFLNGGTQGALIEVHLEEGYDVIPSYAFSEFPGMGAFFCPASVTTISKRGLYNNPDLYYVDLSMAKAEYIHAEALANSGNANAPMKVLFPKTTFYIEEGSFRGSSIGELDLSDTKTDGIAMNSFRGCTCLTRVKLPASLNWMGPNTFADCTSLQEINLEDADLYYLAEQLFKNCTSLKTITLPKNLGAVDYEVFANCTALKTLNFLGDLPYFYNFYDDRGNDAFIGTKMTAYYPNTKAWNSVKNSPKKYKFGGKVTWKSYNPNTYLPAIPLKLTATAPYNYGEPVMPKFTLKNAKKHVLVEGTDYTITCKNNTEIGQEACATIKGIGDYSGTRKIYYKIVPIPISKVILSETAYPYDGEIHMPRVTIMAGDAILLENGTESNEWVELSMKADTSVPGTYTVTAKGLGIYGSSKSAKYKITVCPVEMTKVGAVSKGFKASWNALPEEPITGYQIQYDMDEAVLKKNKGTMVNVENPAAASKKVTGLKAKTSYYVKMRTYLVLGEKTYYSSWTDVKAVTTKK